jgi:hypothetical protein
MGNITPADAAKVIAQAGVAGAGTFYVTDLAIGKSVPNEYVVPLVAYSAAIIAYPFVSGMVSERRRLAGAGTTAGVTEGLAEGIPKGIALAAGGTAGYAAIRYIFPSIPPVAVAGLVPALVFAGLTFPLVRWQ